MMGIFDFLKAVPSLLREKAEEVTLIAGVKGRIPLAVKAAAAISLIPGALASIIPATLKGKVIAGTATILGTGILAKSPAAREFVVAKIEKIPEVPKEIYQFGEKVGGVVEGESVFGKEDIIKGVKTAGIVGGIAAAGAVVIPYVKKKIEKRKAATTPVLPVEPEKQIIPEKQKGIKGEVPITPEVTTITTGKKPYKRRRAKIIPSVRQSVKINVIASPRASISKRYINQPLLC